MNRGIGSSLTEFISSDTAKIGTAVILLGGGAAWLLLKMRQGHYLGKITQETRVCLRKSGAFAIGSLALGSIPVFAMRKLGWSTVKPLYVDILFRNRYTGVITLVSVLLLAVFSVVFPVKKNKYTKYELWAATCLTVGTMLAPIVLTPSDILTITSGYVLGLTIPIAVTCAVSPNFLFLNAFALFSVSLSTIFMHHFAIPWVIHRRHQIAGTVPYLPARTISTLLLSTALMCAVLMMVNVNLFVGHVQKCHDAKNQTPDKSKARVKSKGGVARPKKHAPLEYEESSWKIDGTDEVTNGIIIAGYSVFTFLQVWWEAMKLLYSLVRRPKKYYEDE